MNSPNDSQGPLVLAINLARREDRRTLLMSSFGAIGIKPNFISAVDGSDVSVQSMPGLSNAEIGVWHSQILAMKDFLKTDFEFALILEDDAFPGPKFSNIKLLELTSLARGKGIDLLQVGFIEHLYGRFRPRGFLDSLQIFKQRRKVRASNPRATYVANEFRAGAHAYLISRRAAKILVNLVPKPPLMAFDSYLEHLARQGGRNTGLQISRLDKSLISQQSRKFSWSHVDSDVSGL